MNDFLAKAGAYALALQAFLASHPELVVPLIGALVTFLCKPRTPAQYDAIAKTSPRLAAFLQLFAAIFPDPVKASKVFTKVVTGKSDPPPPPPEGPTSGSWPTSPKKPTGLPFVALVVGAIMLVSVSVAPTRSNVDRVERVASAMVEPAVTHAPAANLTGCAFLQKHAKDALSVAQIGCIIANQFLPDSKVAEVCEIADDYFEPMQRVLADARKKSDEVAAQAVESTREAHCGKRLTP